MQYPNPILAPPSCHSRLGLVPFVQPRPIDERIVVSKKETDRIRSDDLLQLAQQIEVSRDLVRNRACDRLSAIAEQMEFLHKKALDVLKEAALDEELHKVPCNMQKSPGRIYHLYEKPDGARYFSMLSPTDWGTSEKINEFLGSYRLEYDRSFTPIEKADRRDQQFSKFENLLQRGELPQALLQ